MLEEEYQQQLMELQGDIKSIKKALDKQARKRKNFDNSSSDTIRQMTEENQRLTMLVKQSGEKEKELISRKLTINTQVAVKNTNMQEHFNKMEELNKEICDIGTAKSALEKQIEAITKEISSMTKAVEHSANKVRQMVRKTKNQENIHLNHEAECEKLRSANQQLLARLEKALSMDESELTKPESLLLEIKTFDSTYQENKVQNSNENDGNQEETAMDYETEEVEKEMEDLRDEVVMSIKCQLS